MNRRVMKIKFLLLYEYWAEVKETNSRCFFVLFEWEGTKVQVTGYYYFL